MKLEIDAETLEKKDDCATSLRKEGVVVARDEERRTHTEASTISTTVLKFYQRHLLRVSFGNG